MQKKKSLEKWFNLLKVIFAFLRLLCKSFNNFRRRTTQSDGENFIQN